MGLVSCNFNLSGLYSVQKHQEILKVLFYAIVMLTFNVALKTNGKYKTLCFATVCEQLHH